MIACKFKLFKQQKLTVANKKLSTVEHWEDGYYFQTITTKSNIGSTALLGIVCDVSGRMYHIALAHIRIDVRLIEEAESE